MSEIDRRFEDSGRDAMSWHGWGSPVGLGLFFVLCAVTFDLVRLALK